MTNPALTLLTLNLHTWQEPDQRAKFDLIADYIQENIIDVVCFQECAQHRDSPLLPGQSVMKEDNAAHLIRERLRSRGSTYHVAWDWAHYGWDNWEEGVAVLSRHPILEFDARYVSRITSLTDPFGSRKAIRARVNLPGLGAVDFYSAHLSWTDAGLPEQIERLQGWMRAVETGATAVIVTGDFNDRPEGIGYAAMRADGFGDAWLESHAPEERRVTTTWNQCIDYIFYRTRSATLRAASASVVFDGKSQPLVSDHFGLAARFETTVGK